MLNNNIGSWDEVANFLGTKTAEQCKIKIIGIGALKGQKGGMAKQFLQKMSRERKSLIKNDVDKIREGVLLYGKNSIKIKEHS